MPQTSASRRWTLIGLAIALFGVPAIIFVYHRIVADPGASGSVALRELLILALATFLLWIVVTRERLPLSSIGLRWDHFGRSLAWGLGLALVLFAALVGCLALYSLLGIRYGEGGRIAVSMWATLLTLVRAGVVEEMFYRGYALERLEGLTGSKWVAAGVALLAFAGFHYGQGPAGMLIALLFGAILTGFYLWKRNLVAVIFAHFLVDFVPNILLPLIAGDSAA